MRLALRRFRHPAALALGVGLVLAAPGQCSAGDLEPAGITHASTTPTRYTIHIDHEATAGLLRLVLDGARERLAEPRCQAILDTFADLEGRPLRARLEETGQTPEGYLGLVVFYDGRRLPRCEKDGVLAVTHVGGRAVFVCPEELRIRFHRNPVWAEATLIHEALHTLGLGENPPSSREITSEVIRRCRH